MADMMVRYGWALNELNQHLGSNISWSQFDCDEEDITTIEVPKATISVLVTDLTTRERQIIRGICTEI